MTNSPAHDDLIDLPTLRARYASGEWTPAGVLAEALRRIDAAEATHPNVWISRFEATDLDARVAAIEERRAAGDDLPLFGVPVAVKDNIDVVGLWTTAACPEFAYFPERSATVVRLLEDAGAIVVGKTNLDQFATGLVGTRSPYGAPSCAFDAAYVSGGSSSGSAVAVAAGLVPISLGTDTAGSGRVPAGFNNIVGLKPTRGLVSTAGVVPACKSLDCVSIFALSTDDAAAVLDVVGKYDPADPYSRRMPTLAAAIDEAAGPFKFGRPRRDQLQFFGHAGYAAAFEAACDVMRSIGGVEVEIDFAPFVETAKLLYEGPWVAERVAGIRTFWEEKPDEVFPVTRQILSGASKFDAVAAFEALHKLEALRRRVEVEGAKMRVLLLPTSGTPYTHAQVAADPIGTNTNLGYYTNFLNLLDLCAIAVPAGFVEGGMPFGVTVMAPRAWDDRVRAVARRFEQAVALPAGATGKAIAPSPEPQKSAAVKDGIEIAVLGAHLSGLPLNHQLTGAGGRLVRAARTAAWYRFYALPNTAPPKPGMLRSNEPQAHGIELEVWELPTAAFGKFVAAIPPPLGIGSIELEDGTWVKGFLAEPTGVEGAEEITPFGGWRAYVGA